MKSMVWRLPFYFLIVLIFANCNAQKKECEISFNVYNDFFKDKFQTVFFSDKFTKLEIGNLEEFKNKYGIYLTSDELKNLYKRANELEEKGDIGSCSLDSLIVNGAKINQVFREHESTMVIDSSKEDSINRRINEILSMPNEVEKYKLYNDFMRTKEVVDLREQKNHRYPRVVYLSRIAFFNTVAMLHVDVIVPHQLSNGFTAIYRKVNHSWNLIKSVPDN